MPGTVGTWVLVGAGVVTVAVSGALAAREWQRAMPRRWRALELVGLSGWMLVAVVVQAPELWWAAGAVLAPITVTTVGVLGWALTQAGLQSWLRAPVVAVVTAVPLVVALLSLVPGARHLVTTDVGSGQPGPLAWVALVWLALVVTSAASLEMVAAGRAVGPLRTDVVWHAAVTEIGLIAVLVVAAVPAGHTWFAWPPIALTGLGLLVGRWSDDLEPLPAATSSLLDLVSDGLVLVGLEGRVIDLNEVGRAQLAGDDPRTLDPALAPALAEDGERTLVVHGAVLRVRTTTVRDGPVPVARVLSSRDVTELEYMRTELSDQAARDALTGLRNRRYLDQRLSVLIDDAHRTRRPLSIAMVDLDHLKELNDNFGHPAGDRVIVAVARVLSERDDLAVRVGGDEFLVVLDDTDADAAELRGQLWRVATAALPRAPGQPLVTLSIGVAQLAPGMEAAALLSAADSALYAAKMAGRNRVRVGPVTARPTTGAVR